MNEGVREDTILWEGKPEAGFFGGRGALTVSQYQVGIVMQDGEVVDVFSGGKRDIPKGEVRTYVASTAPFTLTFWLMDPMDREEPDDGVVLGQPVLTSDDEAVTGRLALTMRVVWKNVEYLLQLLRPGSGGVTRRDVSDAIEGELLAKVLALDIHQHTAEELRGNRELFRGIYESVNIELASTIRFYGLRLDNFTVTWGLTSEERERIRERRHEEELREMERLQEIEDLAIRWMDRERRHEEELAEIERARERERRHEEELREMEREREIVERQRDLLEKQRELIEGRRGLEDLSEPVRKDPADPPRQSDETEITLILHDAAFRGDTETALALISSGADVNARDGEYGVTPLHTAAIADHTETALALVSAGADVNARNKIGVTPLHVAVFEGYTETALALVTVGADVNARNERGLTPLHSAATADHPETARALASIGADVNARDVIDETPLHSAAVAGSTETALALVTVGVDVNARDVFGRTPLHLAARWGHTETGRALVAAGADVDAENEDGLTPAHLAEMGGHRETASAVNAVPRGCGSVPGEGSAETGGLVSPLHVAAAQGDTKAVRRLISTGADVNVRNENGEFAIENRGVLVHCADGETPLHLAAREGSTETALTLMSAGANVNARSEDGSTPLHLAASRGHTEIALALVGAGASVVARDNDGETPLHRAAWCGDTETALALIVAGADVNARDRAGKMPLHWAAMMGTLWHFMAKDETRRHLAAERGHTEIVMALVSSGADVNVRDGAGRMPLHEAAGGGHTDIAMTLVSAGTDVGAVDGVGRTALHWAARGGHTGIARALISVGADVDAVDEDGLTPARLAEREGHAETAAAIESRRPTPPPPADSQSGDSYWLNMDSTGVVLHKGSCGHVRTSARPPKWKKFSSKESAQESTGRTIQECAICNP